MGRVAGVTFREVFVAAGADVCALQVMGFDCWVQASYDAGSGLFMANKRAHLGKSQRTQLFWEAKRFPLGERQLLWMRNSTKSDVVVSLEIWRQSAEDRGG